MIDRARRVALGWDPGVLPACTAPFSSLVLDADGTVHACEAALRPLLDATADDLRPCFQSAEFAALRGALSRGELPTDHCGACARHVELGLIEQSSLVRDHGTRVPRDGATVPREILVRLDEADRGPVDPARTARQVESLLDTVEVVEIEARDPFGHETFARIVELLANRPAESRPALALRLFSCRDAERAAATLGAVTPRRIRVRAGHALEARLARCRTLAGESGELVVWFLLAPDNWFDIYETARICTALGARIDLRAADPQGVTPIDALPLAEQRALSSLLGSFWYLFADAARPTGIAAEAYPQLREEVRRLVLDNARRGLCADSRTTLSGRGAQLTLPPIEHAMLRDPRFGATLVKGFLGLESSPGLESWVEENAAREEFFEAARRRPWLRLLLLKAGGGRASDRVLTALLELYGDAATRQHLLDEELDFGRREGLATAVEHWHEWYGIDRLAGRKPPYRIGRPKSRVPAAKGTSLPDVDVTVLVPSYRHEAYIEDCLRSVVGQSWPHFRLLVVDDRSPDATVDRARAIDDERIEVRVNDENLGLGNSVLAALDDVDTPFVALLNSDDTFHPKRLERCRRALLQDESAQVVATGLFLVDSDGGTISPDNASRLRDGREVFDWVHWYYAAQPDDPKADLFAQLVEHNFLATSTNLFCRTEFLRAQANALHSLKYCLDWHLFLEAARTGSLRYVGTPLAAYRLHAANTVWFREGRRWTYFLEVNRVAAACLQRFFEDQKSQHAPQEAAVRTLEIAASHLTRNTEVQGFAVFLNELLGGIELERLSETDDRIRRRILELERRAIRMTRLDYAAHGLDDDVLAARLGVLGRMTTLEVSQLTAEILRDDSAAARDSERWARDHADRLERRLSELEQLVPGLRATLDAREGDLGELRGRLEVREAELDEQANKLSERVARLAELLDPLPDEVSELQGRLPDDPTSRLFADLELLSRVAAHLTTQRADDRHRLDELDFALNGANERIAQLRAARKRLEEKRDELRSELEQAHQRTEQEILKLRNSTEWKIGWVLWRKIPLFAKTRRLVRRVFYRTVEFGGRSVMSVKRWWAGRRPHPLKIAAGSTANFPVISHTFVYQELMAMREMLGADVKLFHSQNGDASALHEAFRYLDQNRTQFHSQWDLHVADFHHFQRTRPDRVESLLNALSEAADIPREQLVERYELMLAFTYARRVEAWGAEYVHTYFFYDQALNGLVTSWLLGLPRGLSTYADHMMQDWPLKVVPLHLETADVVVATSKRIAQELIEIGGAKIRDKVVVKPNGVDGRRFKFVRRMPPAHRTLELICISRIEPKKGMLELADTAQLLKKHGRDVRIHVVGDADVGCPGSEQYAERFRGRIAENEVSDLMVLHGRKRQEEMLPLLERADAFVAPFVETESGDKDGIPTAILEAMSTGLPIIATTAGSIPEIIDDGVEGYLVDQRDPQALAASIERLIDDPALAPKLGKAARDRFERDFDIHATEPRLHERVRAAVRARAAATPGAGPGT